MKNHLTPGRRLKEHPSNLTHASYDSGVVFAKFLLVAAILCAVVLGIAMRVRAWRIEREKRRRQIERDGY